MSPPYYRQARQPTLDAPKRAQPPAGTAIPRPAPAPPPTTDVRKAVR